MKLLVYSLKGVEFEGKISSFNVKTRSGEITILNHHRPLVTLLEKGEAKIGLENGASKKLEINSGFLEMDDKNNLSVLMD